MTRSSHCQFPLTLLRFWCRRTALMLFLIGLIIFLFQLAVCGIVHDNEKVRVFLNMINTLPSFIKAALGGEALQVGNITGLITIGYQHPMILTLYMIYAVAVPSGLLVGEKQRGTMELILCRQVTKTQVYICVALLTLAGMFLLTIVMFLGTVASTHIYEFDDEIPLYSLFRLAINAGMLASTVGAIALLSSSIFRRRVQAINITIIFLVIQYFIYIISEWWPPMNWLYPASLFYYIGKADIFIRNQWPLGHLCVLGSVLITATLAGHIIWSRRDLI
ncbi:MAG: ABC transporter permease subunit [Sedimentisphaerales bacterium]|nr:ABC transporter permease subunit [Sedimentisphaerales bacterium]